MNMILSPFAILCLIKKNVYRQKMVNYIETFSLLNIVILCSVNWVTNTTRYERLRAIGELVTYISVAVMMMLFLWILFYQGRKKITSKFKWRRKNIREVNAVSETKPKHSPPTCSVVEVNDLKEPLLDTDLN